MATKVQSGTSALVVPSSKLDTTGRDVEMRMATPETGSSTAGSSKSMVNPFFAGLTYSQQRKEGGGEEQRVPTGPTFSLREPVDANKTFPLTPTSVQRSLCLNATSNVDVNLTDDDADPESPLASAVRLTNRPGSNCGRQTTVVANRRKVSKQLSCVCAAVPEQQRKTSAAQSCAVDTDETVEPSTFPYKTSPITDEYKITHEIIGIGESGKVMACFSKATGEKYALKVLRDGPRSRREVYLHYLTNTHDNIVTIIDIFENTFDCVKCLLVVVEFLEGGDLLTRFENQGRNPYPEPLVARIIGQLARAVEFLHSKNIAHRDIKLENILCSSADLENCVFKLADFGFAKRPERNCLLESPCCTPAYVCPEILSHERYDKMCDMWAVGVCMYILLCGYPPFYSMKGLPFSPGMKDRITVGLYAFPPEDWDHISQSTKNEIRCLLRTDPHTRTTIQQLLAGPFLNPKPNRMSLPVVFSDVSLSSMDDGNCAVQGGQAQGEERRGREKGIGSDGLTPIAGSGTDLAGAAGSPDSAIDSSYASSCCFSSDESSDEKSVSAEPMPDSQAAGGGEKKPKFSLGSSFSSNSPRLNRTRSQSGRRGSAARLPPHAVSARFLQPLTGSRSRNAEVARLYSIQEEVGRALDMMRLGGDSCFMKSLKVASGNKLLERRKAATSSAVTNAIVTTDEH